MIDAIRTTARILFMDDDADVLAATSRACEHSPCASEQTLQDSQ